MEIQHDPATWSECRILRNGLNWSNSDIHNLFNAPNNISQHLTWPININNQLILQLVSYNKLKGFQFSCLVTAINCILAKNDLKQLHKATISKKTNKLFQTWISIRSFNNQKYKTKYIAKLEEFFNASWMPSSSYHIISNIISHLKEYYYTISYISYQ